MNFINQPVKNRLFLTGFFVFVTLFSGCDSQPTSGIFLSGETMGTTYHITIAAKITNENKELLKKEIDSRLLQVNASFSTYIKSSEVSQFNSYKGLDWKKKSDEFIKVLAEAQRISDITQGAYDITVGPLVNLWGFGPSFNKEDMPSEQAIRNTLSKVGYKNIVFRQKDKQIKKLKDDLYIDFSSIAKGYGVDVIAEMLESKGYSNYMVEIGGEMRVSGVNSQKIKWRIAVEKPDSKARAIHRVINVTNMAIATSGDYRNFFEKDGIKYSHTIDPKTGRPVQHHLASVTVLAKSSMTADAWATAFMVLGNKKGYDLAMQNNLAVLFLVKVGDELKEVFTPAFVIMTKEYAS